MITAVGDHGAMDELGCSSAGSAATEHAATETLQARQAADLTFTRLGSWLVAVTPRQTLTARRHRRSAYSSRERLKYVRGIDRQLPPHIFEQGARALSAVAADGERQCVLLSGCSGSGKTYLSLQLALQLCSGAAGASRLDGALISSNALLAAIADAQNTPSRYSRATSFYFAHDGRVEVCRVTASLHGHCVMLPGPRDGSGSVPMPPIFRALAGVARHLNLGLEHAAHSRYWSGALAAELGDSSGVDGGAADGAEGASRVASDVSAHLTAIGIQTHAQGALWRAVAAVVHLGCVGETVDSGGGGDADGSASIGWAAHLLGCVGDALSAALAREGASAARAEKERVDGGEDGGGARPSLSCEARMLAKGAHALALWIMSRIFEHVCDATNTSLAATIAADAAQRVSLVGAPAPPFFFLCFFLAHSAQLAMLHTCRAPFLCEPPPNS